jgi:hypothetical protein
LFVAKLKFHCFFFVFSCFVPYGYLSFNRTQEFQYGFYLLSLIGSLICPHSTAQNACRAKTIAFQKAVVCQNSGHFRSQGCSVNSEQQLKTSKGELRTVNVGSAKRKQDFVPNYSLQNSDSTQMDHGTALSF